MNQASMDSKRCTSHCVRRSTRNVRQRYASDSASIHINDNIHNITHISLLNWNLLLCRDVTYWFCDLWLVGCPGLFGLLGHLCALWQWESGRGVEASIWLKWLSGLTVCLWTLQLTDTAYCSLVLDRSHRGGKAALGMLIGRG